ncbi:hypothetical protein [Nitrosomonas sp. sh817]|uniref:hypothetical protein n=1 Tax=Nitrosomonas sp. sh817 TaxID=3070658 RepID=UPI0027DC2B18|nr:hypothetical protein [Nitrosomonas sp. sh817]WMJ07570.1 hypothetical protein RBH92_08990 [Nitrosomonas sp. sh817]
MSDNDNRWWEYYAVRYLVGTVVGAGVVAALNQIPGSPYVSLLSSLTHFKDASFKDLALFGAIGFAFCYIASAPVLALHSAREHLRLTQLYNHPRNFFLCLAISIIVSVTPSLYLAPTLPALVLAGILTLQVFPLLCTFSTNFREVEIFYEHLSTARAKGKGEKPDYAVKEVVESFRHLREHGNAMLILVFELILAFILFKLYCSSFAIPVLLLWLAPACSAWLVATIVEVRFAHKYGKP